MDTTTWVRQSTIADRLNLTRQAVGKWIERPFCAFPQPVATIDGVKFWDWRTVRDWHATREDVK
jgi:hypothetical protein